MPQRVVVGAGVLAWRRRRPVLVLAAVVLVVALWYVGRRVRMRGEGLALLRERADHLERQRRAEAERAGAEERAHIARELHEVVAHRVGMMTVQAGAARTVARIDPDGAVEAMAEVEHGGRQALGELRHLLGVLRPGSEGSLGPRPGAADIAHLVAEHAAAGMDVPLRIDGEPSEQSGPVELYAYRIVQEALANASRHAGRNARTEVRVETEPGMVTIEVTDDGVGGTVGVGSGHGIIGMRERAQLLGGSLEAGPRPDGGFRVVARLPTGSELR